MPLRSAVAAGLLVLAVSAASAQMILPREDGSIPAPPGPGAPAFEVTSVKPAAPSRPDVPPMSLQPFRLNGMTLRQIITQAYGLRSYQLVESPDWIETARFDIAASVPAGSQPRPIPAMLRQLLADRFKLEVRITTRELPIYELVRARADGTFTPGLKPTTIDCDVILNERIAKAEATGDPLLVFRPPERGEPVVCNVRMEVRFVDGALVETRTGSGQPFEALVSVIRSASNRWVVDRTGLTGRFDYELRFSQSVSRDLRGALQPIAGGAAEPALDAGIPIELAVQALGLRLEPARGPVQVLSIDRVEPPVPD